jgi:hypothetical protein
VAHTWQTLDCNAESLYSKIRYKVWFGRSKPPFLPTHYRNPPGGATCVTRPALRHRLIKHPTDPTTVLRGVAPPAARTPRALSSFQNPVKIVPFPFRLSFAMPANVLFPPPPARRTLLAAPSTVVCASRGAWPLALSRTSPASLLLPVGRPHQITRLSPSFAFPPPSRPRLLRGVAASRLAFARLRVAPHTPCHTYIPSTAIRSTPRLRRSRASPRPSPRPGIDSPRPACLCLGLPSF